MPRIPRRRSRAEKSLTITITFTGDVGAAYDAARRVLDAGTLQDAMLESAPGVAITNAEVK